MDIEKAKQYLESYQRLAGYGFVGRFLSPEAKEYQQTTPPCQRDDILNWCVRRALECLNG
jgi:hypothetical protein